MIKLKPLTKLIPYKQDYSVWYADDNKSDYYCIYCSYANKPYIEFMRKYGALSVKHIVAGRAEELHIYLKEGSINNEV